MALTPSTMLALGTVAPDFALPSTQGKTVSLSDFQAAPALLVMFLCNHCPYVKHVQEVLVDMTREYQKRGVAVVGISSNDAKAYPEDSFKKMAVEAERAGYTFPYLYDESQEVARAYRAACTPDFYLFNEARRLVYRGQMDSSRPGNSVPVTGADLRAALEATLAKKRTLPRQMPSMGCNIKWKPGHEPDYFGTRSQTSP